MQVGRAYQCERAYVGVFPIQYDRNFANFKQRNNCCNCDPASPSGTLSQCIHVSSMITTVLYVYSQCWAETTYPHDAVCARATNQWWTNVPCSFMIQRFGIKDPLPPPQQGEWPEAPYRTPDTTWLYDPWLVRTRFLRLQLRQATGVLVGNISARGRH